PRRLCRCRCRTGRRPPWTRRLPSRCRSFDARSSAFLRHLAQPERILELTLAHFRASLDAPAFRLGIEFLAGMSVAFARAGGRGLAASGGGLAGVAAGHCPRALSFPVGADMGLAFALLLGGAALGFLAFGAA